MPQPTTPLFATDTGDADQEWGVREIVSYAGRTPPRAEIPKIVRAAVIFELGGARGLLTMRS